MFYLIRNNKTNNIVVVKELSDWLWQEGWRTVALLNPSEIKPHEVLEQQEVFRQQQHGV